MHSSRTPTSHKSGPRSNSSWCFPLRSHNATAHLRCGMALHTGSACLSSEAGHVCMHSSGQCCGEFFATYVRLFYFTQLTYIVMQHISA